MICCRGNVFISYNPLNINVERGEKNEIIAPKKANILPWIFSGISVTYQTWRGIVKKDSINVIEKRESRIKLNAIGLLEKNVLNPKNDIASVEPSIME